MCRNNQCVFRIFAVDVFRDSVGIALIPPDELQMNGMAAERGRSQ